jgi:hypothetical protein
MTSDKQGEGVGGGSQYLSLLKIKEKRGVNNSTMLLALSQHILFFLRYSLFSENKPKFIA